MAAHLVRGNVCVMATPAGVHTHPHPTCDTVCVHRCPHARACAQPQRAGGSPVFNSTALHVRNIFLKSPFRGKGETQTPQI